MPGLISHLKDISTLFYSFILIFFLLPIPDWQFFISNLMNLNSNEVKELYSSVTCRGNNHTERICKFNNLCYSTKYKEFIFFHSEKSEIVGLPEDKFSPALIDFSSVYDHNTQYFNFVDLPSSSYTNFSINYVNGIALIFKRFNPENLMHVFHDDLIPAYVTLKENFLLHERSNVFFVFADGRESGPYSYLYENFLTRYPLYLNILPSEVICFENAIIGLNKHSLWYQYGFKSPQGPLNKDMATLYPTLTSFCTYFKMQFHLTEMPVESSAVILNRRHNRKIINVKAVAKKVEEKTHLKTSIISLEEYSVLDIIKIIMASKLVVGVHGSLLILSLFLPHNSQIIELFPYGINPDICTPYKALAEIPGLKLIYHSWENQVAENSFPHPEYPPELGGIMHLPQNVQEQIKSSVVKPFLCCYDAVWLYRIYQDTFVDLKSFSFLLNKLRSDYKSHYTSKSLIISRLFPSVVQNISCHLNSNNVYIISWEKPWNLAFIDISLIEYELWYQSAEENDTKAFIMKKTFFSFPANVSNIYVWIRCHIDGKIGPFNTDPLVCQS